MKIYTVKLFVIFLLLQSCLPKPKNKTLTYQNIVIISDLSDRIEPTINSNIPNQQYPSKDIKEISKLLDYFKNECVKPGEKIGDKSSISFYTFSNEPIASIDIDNIKDLGKKQQFINSTGTFENNGLEHQISEFQKKVQYAYDNVRNKGIDLISVTLDEIERNDLFVKEGTVLINGIDTTYVNYENHIYIFTDGYLEYKGKNKNNQFYFGDPEIRKIRKICKKNNIDIKTVLENNKELRLPALLNKKYQQVNLHILETAERDKNTKLQTYKNPTGLRDNEILEAVWRKWSTETGFKSFEWRKY